MKHLSIFLVISAFLAGCTGMNQAECLNANWELIGVQDGSYGREISYANRHQEDCAKHGMQVDMDAYRLGHAEGVKTFCRAENGFKVGRSGKSYSGICPAELEDAFLSEYEIGQEFYYLDKDISDTKKAINTHLATIEDLNDDIDRIADRAVQLDVSRDQRERMQEQMKEIQFEILDLERLVGDAQLNLEAREADLRELSNYYFR